MPAERPAAVSPPASAAATPPNAASGSPRPGGSAGGTSALDEGGAKETVESILVAFILAFIFRAFIVEAFVIPTGSMAPTLLGAHMRFRCQDCGYRFDANYSPTPTGGDDLYIPTRAPADRTYRVYCPNCGYRIPQNDPADHENDASQPEVHYGDRILVLKYLYLFEDPQRWDVVVFKSPDVRGKDDEGYNPDAPTYQQNYIKRLVGKPMESVMILDGDIYVGQPGEEVNAFTIQTKPRPVQDALWRVIYDNDYVPQRLMRSDGSKWRQPWTVREGSGWTFAEAPTPDGRVFRFNNTAGESTIYFDRNANPGNQPFTDWLAYDVESIPPRNVVHDLKLSFTYARSAGDGPLRAKITRGDDEFIAILTGKDARLVHVNKGVEQPIGQPVPLAAADKRPLRVELSAVDYQVTLRIDDTDIARTAPEQYRPNVADLLDAYKHDRPRPWPSVEITAANQTAALAHIGLWRDIYYTNRTNPGQGPPVWGVPANLPNSIMHLGKDEYFVLGDNSLISGDARYWRVPIELPSNGLQVLSGRVPGRFMLGRAFFVYWPAGFRPLPTLPGVVPDFGDMRFIR
jgi:signal peptidase I